jgi:hypothetical protein
MKSKSLRYPGLCAGSYGEQAVDIVLAQHPLTGPELAARLGISTYEVGCLRKPVQLGYLTKTRGTDGRGHAVNLFTPGAKTAGQQDADQGDGKSVPHQLLELIAANGTMTSVALGAATGLEPGAVSTRLNKAIKHGVVKVRLVQHPGIQKLIHEYFDADVSLYLSDYSRPGGHRPRQVTPPAYQGEVVPPREPREFRPLSIRIGPASFRPGAWDFREVRSLHEGKPCA